jgi:hypothetical protein
MTFDPLVAGSNPALALRQVPSVKWISDSSTRWASRAHEQHSTRQDGVIGRHLPQHYFCHSIAEACAERDRRAAIALMSLCALQRNR